MLFNTLLICLAYLSIAGYAGYVLEDDYLADGNFFNKFTFWNTGDPTNGFVDFVDYDTAMRTSLINGSSSNVRLGVDSTNITPNGRPSVRLTSNKAYNSGLIIVDIEHMPGGICGTWPAFWMVGPDWPHQGEIDIIEGVNDQSTNGMTLHTGPGCSITNNNAFSGSINTPNCDVNAPGQSGNQGCSIGTTDASTYGAGFNANNGGVYATEYTSSSISIFFFPRNSVPSDIIDGAPDPFGWGKPVAQFQGGCNIGSTFTNQQIVFDTTFCGSWAGAAWSGTCASKASTCNAYVENNPTDFADAYWSVNALKVYQASGSTTSNVLAPPAVESSSTTVSMVVPSQSIYSAPMQSPTTIAISIDPEASKNYPATSTITLTTTLPSPSTSPTSVVYFPAGNATNGTSPTGPVGSASALYTNATGTIYSGPLMTPSPAASSVYPVSAPNRERHLRHMRSHKRHVAGRL